MSLVTVVARVGVLERRYEQLEQKVEKLLGLINDKLSAPEGAPDVGQIDIPPRAQALKKIGLGTDPPEAEDSP